MPSSMALPAPPMRATQLTMPITMSAKMITRTISQVRRFLGGADQPLPFLHNRRGEGGLDVAGHLDLHRTDLGQLRLRPHPVSGVAAVAAGWVVLVVAEMIAHLRLER